MCELDLPLISGENSTNCDSNLFEYYEPASTVIQVVYLAGHVISLVAFSIIFVQYTRQKKSVLWSLLTTSCCIPRTRDLIVVKATTLNLLYNLIGLSGTFNYGLNGLLLKEGLDSQAGRIDAFMFYVAVHFLYNVHYQFVPVLYQLAGFGQVITSTRKKFNWLLSLMPLYGIITSAVYFHLIFTVQINIHQYFMFMFLTFFVNSNVLGFSLMVVIGTLVKELERLDKLNKSDSEEQPIRDVIFRLRFYEKVTMLFFVLIYTNTVVLANPNLTKKHGIYLFYSVYCFVPSLNSLPLILVYKKFILPGDKKCLSFVDSREKTPLPLSSGMKGSLQYSGKGSYLSFRKLNSENEKGKSESKDRTVTL
eukprot:snap_masked-scaffold_2-processed-gene-7.47-mRNA-1 protein AED:1.00 eAED:1.00 QI:0/-1/0/0/-1/1/1/0/363